MASNVIASNNNIHKIAKSMGDGTKDGVSKDLSTVASAVNIFVDQLMAFGTKDLKTLKGTTQQFINTFKLYVDVVGAITSVDTSVFKKASNINSLTKFTKNFGELITNLGGAFGSLTQLGKDNDAYTNLRKVLTNNKITHGDKSEVDANGIGIATNGTTEESGSLMDCVNIILEVYKNLSTLETNGLLKGWWKKNVTNKLILATFKYDILGLFEKIWKETVRVFNPFSGKTVKKTYTAILALQKVTLTLPSLIEELSKPYLYIGKKRRTKKLQRGFEMVVGTGDVVAETKDGKAHKTYLIGVVMNTLEAFALINRSYGNDLNTIAPMLTAFGDALKNIVKTLIFVSINALAIWVGSKVLLGSNKKKGRGGLIGVILMALTRIQQKNKDITLATKSIVDISKSIFLLSAAAVMIALTGVFIVQARWFILAGLGFVGLLVLLISGLASKLFQKNIKEGSKSIVLLSSALALISLTAVLIAYTGQFILASWDSILQFGLLVVVLGIVMWGLSHMKDTVLESTKTILLLSLAIGLISLIAVGLVWVSQYLDGNWEQIGMFGVVFIGIVGVMLLASFLAQKIDMEGILTISICILISTVSIMLLATTVRIAGDMTSLLSAAGIMAGIITVFSALAVGLGAIGPMVALGAVVLGVIVGIVVTASIAMNLIANAAKTIKETGYDTEGLKTVIKMPFEAVFSLFGLLDTINPIQLASTTIKMYGLMSITRNIGRMASVLQDIAQLRMPEDFDKEGKPTGYRKMEVKDFVLAGQNAAAVATVLTNMFSEDGEDKQVTIAGTTITLSTINLGNIAHLRNRHKRRMERLALITDSIGKMATVIRDIASLTIPIYDSNGKQTGVRQMTVEDFNTATENAATIVKTLTGIFVDPRVIVATKLTDKDDAETVGAVLSAVGNLSSVTSVLALLADGNIPLETKTENGQIVVGKTVPLSNILKQQDTISSNISTLLLMIIKGVTNVDADLIDDASDRVKGLNDVIKCTVDSTKYVVEWYNTTLKSINVDELNTKYEGTNKTLSGLVALFAGKNFTSTSASSFDKQTKSLANVLKQVNETDFDKLKYTYSLVSKLAEFARSIRGDFDKLAECINEDLIEAIEKLNETLNGTTKDINVTTTTTAQMLPNNSGTDKQSQATKTNETNALKAQIAELQRQISELKNAQKPQRIKLDSTGAVVVKIAN